MRRVALYLLVPIIAAAQQPAPRPSGRWPALDTPPAPAKPEDLCAVEGQVVNSTTGEPLGKAALTLRRAESQPGPPGPARSYSATSDPSGKFSIGNVEPGKYRLSATRT